MMREQQVLDFERIGSLAEENASLTVGPSAFANQTSAGIR